jgi:acetyl esterase/lipase
MRQTILWLMLLLNSQLLFAETYSVRVVRDVRYADREYALKKDRLDIYIPEGKKSFPVAVSIHGGSLTEGDKSAETHVGQTFARAGIGTVVINYRLTPVTSHPGHIEDAAQAFAWVKHHIAEYGGDPANVFLIGHSAGAYLISLLALDPRYLAVHKLSPTEIRGVVPVSAFYDVEEVAPDRPLQIWGNDPKMWRDASPIRYVKSSAPPFLILYADRDEPWRREQNQAMATALKRAGHKNTQIRQMADRNHMSVWYNMRERDEVAEAIIEFVLKR